MNNERKKAGAEAVDYINKYLISARWQLNTQYLLFIDPVTEAAYTSDVAFIVQLNRDVNPTLK